MIHDFDMDDIQIILDNISRSEPTVSEDNLVESIHNIGIALACLGLIMLWDRSSHV